MLDAASHAAASDRSKLPGNARSCPTFVVELFPIVDVLPTWTGCVALVVAMRKKSPPPGAGGDHGVTIDVKPTSVT